MQESNRVKIVYKNTIVVLLTQIIIIVLGFVIRKIFILTLGVQYLGYNSVFTNILQMLNLADMGIGVAITSFLYRPIADHDVERIKALMYMYKKVYQILGLVVILFGIIISIFIPYFITDANCSNGYLRLLFYINLLGTASTYYLAYKKTLLIASQKTYLCSIIDTLVYLLVSATQLILLFIYPNYIVFLVLTILKNFISNLITSYICNKEYGYLNKDVNKILIREYKLPVMNYVKDVFLSKIGSYVFYSTDNIIISIFKGSLLTGYLSNYTMVTNQIQAIVIQVLSSLQATLGIYINNKENIEDQKKMVDNYLYVNYFIGNFCMLCIIFLVQPFIQLLFGKEFLMKLSTIIWLSINLLLTIVIQLPSQLFVIYKLYHYDRYIVGVSAAINIILSVFLINIIGLDGVLIGTFVTSLIYLYSRFYIICTKIFHTSFLIYFKKILYYISISIITFLLLLFITSIIPFDITILDFIFKIIMIGSISLLVPILLTLKTNELRYVCNKFIPEKIKKLLFINRG